MKTVCFERVLAITPNPALDLSGETADIIANEKNYIFHERRSAGGNAINAARVLHELDCRVAASGFVGGSVGEQLKTLLNLDGVRSDFVKIKNETRINITVANKKSKQQTRFSFPGPKVALVEKNALMKKLSATDNRSLYILGGSFPQNFAVSDAEKIIRDAHKKGIATVVDVPFESLGCLLDSHPLMIKPNLAEFEGLVGKKDLQFQQILSEAKKLLKSVPIICISSVNNGVLLLTKDQSFFAVGPKVSAQSSVGAGDSLVGAMVAGMIEARLSYKMFFADKNSRLPNIPAAAWEKILARGLGAALATITLPGTELGKKKQIDAYAAKIQVSQILL